MQVPTDLLHFIILFAAYLNIGEIPLEVYVLEVSEEELSIIFV